MIAEEINELKSHYRRYLDKIGKKFSDRPFIDRCLQEVKGSGSLIVSAPTGYGKSLISLFAAYLTILNREGWEKLIVAFPTRALIHQQVQKFKGTFYEKNDLIGIRHMGAQESRYLYKPVTITTYDTLSMTSFGLSPDDSISADADEYFLPHYLFSRFSAMISNLVLDEAHLMYDSQKSLSYLFFIAYLYQKVMRKKLILLSATMPDSFTIKLQSFFNFKLLEMSESDDREFWQMKREKKYGISIKSLSGKGEAVSFIVSTLKERNYRRALVVMNTVEEAQEVYSSLKGSVDRALLIHSRYTDQDKERKVEEINGLNEGIVVGTQSVEVGIDNSFDLIITDASPLNSLVQRFGRFLRDESDSVGEAYIIFDSGEKGQKYRGVYDLALVKKSLEVLMKRQSENRALNLHVDYKPLLNEVYTDEVQIPHNALSKMYGVFTDFSYEPLHRLFMEMGGSFIRDEILVEGRVSNVSVPVDFSFAEKHAEKIICGGKEVAAPKDLFKYALNGCSFVLGGVRYDSELGLVTRVA